MEELNKRDKQKGQSPQQEQRGEQEAEEGEAEEEELDADALGALMLYDYFDGKIQTEPMKASMLTNV